MTVGGALQKDLFARGGDFAIDTSFTTAKRTALDAHSWVEIVPGWVSGTESVLDQLLAEVPWKQHHRRLFDRMMLEPRLTAEYRDLRGAPAPLVDMAATLSSRYGVTYDSLWLNLYRNGRDSTGWHRDRFSCRRPLCVVPVLTLGAARRFLLKPRDGGSSIALAPRSGDLIVMGGRCQEDWLHGVPKSPTTPGARVSVNFQSSAQARR
jgi:alkylated DNA repair dioxygenase AlkB